MSTAPYAVDITVSNVIKALGAFLQPFAPGAQIVRGQRNRVSPPSADGSPSPYIRLTEILKVDLETPTVTNNRGQAQIITVSPKRIDIQMDFYGAAAGDYSAAVQGIWRTAYTCSQFPANIQPLYLSDARQMPLTTAEQQYETRWTLTAYMQYNPTVIVPQDYFTSLKVNILEDLP